MVKNVSEAKKPQTFVIDLDGDKYEATKDEFVQFGWMLRHLYIEYDREGYNKYIEQKKFLKELIAIIYLKCNHIPGLKAKSKGMFNGL